MTNQFPKLLEPIRLGNSTVPNRTVMLAMGLNYIPADQSVGQRLIDFYEERAKGGCGLIIVQMEPVFSGSLHSPAIFDNSNIPGARRLVKAVHEHGSKACVQLAVRQAWSRDPGSPVEFIGPSPEEMKALSGHPCSRSLNVEEIRHICNQLGDAAARAREAGFDAVEIHGGMGYLLSRFLSTYSNKRTDDYGGPLENRMRFLLEAVENVRGKAGKDFTLICRISVDEFMPGGNSVEEQLAVCRALEKAGVHGFNVQAGWHESTRPLIQMSVPRGAFVYLAEKTKKAVSIPVIAAYRLNDPFMCEDIIRSGKADMFGMGRQFIADAYFVKKAAEGRPDDIVSCIACSRCTEMAMAGLAVGCTVNPTAGKESESKVTKTKAPQKVIVIGGGPAGMEAATIASHRGHNVTLLEKTGKLGGQSLLASIPPHKEEIGHFVSFLSRHVEKSGAKVTLNSEATIESLQKENPDVIILATGAMPALPPILGAKSPHVVTFEEILRGTKMAGDRVVVIGGGPIGCETAELLFEQGKRVTIVEMLGRIADRIGKVNRWVVMQRLKNDGIKMETGCKVESITATQVNVSRGDTRWAIDADTVVLATGTKCEDKLWKCLQGSSTKTYAIGDCCGLGEAERLAKAIEDGFLVAKSL